LRNQHRARVSAALRPEQGWVRKQPNGDELSPNDQLGRSAGIAAHLPNWIYWHGGAEPTHSLFLRRASPDVSAGENQAWAERDHPGLPPGAQRISALGRRWSLFRSNTHCPSRSLATLVAYLSSEVVRYGIERPAFWRYVSG
jgi:hypothetical protein